MEATRRHDSFRLPPGAIFLALAIKYFLLICYGIHATIVAVPSFVTVGGEGFAVGWAMTVTVLAAVAFAAVLRTWFTEHFRFEKWATGALILGYLFYSIVLIVRGSLTGDWSSIPIAWLPAALTVLPIVRYYWLVARAVPA